MFEIFDLISFSNSQYNGNRYRPIHAPMDRDILESADLRDAIIYLERKAEEMETNNGCVNVSGKTRTEITEINEILAKRVAPYRKAIEILQAANKKPNPITT